MPAIELHKPDGSPTRIFYCEKCRVIHRDQGSAESCCGQRICECGSVVESRYHPLCNACERKKRNQEDTEREAGRFEKAEKIQECEWDGWVYTDGIGHNEGYFDSAEDLREHLESDFDEDERAAPAYVWATTSSPVCVLDPERILESATEEAWDGFDASVDLNGIAELKLAIDAFNKANASVLSYQPDFKKAVLLKK